MPRKEIRVESKCQECGVCFMAVRYLLNAGGAKFCGRKCAGASRVGKPSWNKGLIGWRKGEKHPWMPHGEEHWSYKGEGVGYGGLHIWVRKNLGSASKCVHCGLTEIPEGMKRYFQWANKSHQYKRDLNDWIELCVKCHKAYDKANREVKKKSQC